MAQNNNPPTPPNRSTRRFAEFGDPRDTKPPLSSESKDSSQRRNDLYLYLGIAMVPIGVSGIIFTDLTWFRTGAGVFFAALGALFLLRAFISRIFVIEGRDEKRFNDSHVIETIHIPPKARRGSWVLSALLVVVLSLGSGMTHYELFNGHKTPAVIPAVPAMEKLVHAKDPPPAPKPFPNKPLVLLMLSPGSGGVLRNNSDEELFVSSMEAVTTLPGADDSINFSIGKDIPPHSDVNFGPAISGSWDTLTALGPDNWDDALRLANQQYGNCARPLPFDPNSIELKTIMKHYAQGHVPLPIGNAVGTISYTRGSETKQETLNLKTVIFVAKGCTPPQPTPNGVPK